MAKWPPTYPIFPAMSSYAANCCRHRRGTSLVGRKSSEGKGKGGITGLGCPSVTRFLFKLGRTCPDGRHLLTRWSLPKHDLRNLGDRQPRSGYGHHVPGPCDGHEQKLVAQSSKEEEEEEDGGNFGTARKEPGRADLPPLRK